MACDRLLVEAVEELRGGAGVTENPCNSCSMNRRQSQISRTSAATVAVAPEIASSRGGERAKDMLECNKNKSVVFSDSIKSSLLRLGTQTTRFISSKLAQREEVDGGGGSEDFYCCHLR